jgi:hypothetical protein
MIRRPRTRTSAWSYSGPARPERPLPESATGPDDPLRFGALDDVLPWRHKLVRLRRFLGC